MNIKTLKVITSAVWAIITIVVIGVVIYLVTLDNWELKQLAFEIGIVRNED